MKVENIMTSDPEVARPDESVQSAACRMRELEVGMIPVCDGERLVGMLTDRDIAIRVAAEGLSPADTAVREVMTPDVVYCFEDQQVDEAAELMEKKQIRRLIVLSRDKKMTGIVSLGDLAVKAGRDSLSGEALEQISEPARPARAAT